MRLLGIFLDIDEFDGAAKSLKRPGNAGIKAGLGPCEAKIS